MLDHAYFTCLHTGDSTTPLLSAQRGSPLRCAGINKHDNYCVPYPVLSLFEAKGVEWRGLFFGRELAGDITKTALPVKGSELGALFKPCLRVR